MKITVSVEFQDVTDFDLEPQLYSAGRLAEGLTKMVGFFCNNSGLTTVQMITTDETDSEFVPVVQNFEVQ